MAAAETIIALPRGGPSSGAEGVASTYVLPTAALRAMHAPLWHLAEAEAAAILAGAGRAQLLAIAEAGPCLVRARLGAPGCELPNRNALLLATGALHILLWGGPRAVEGGAA